MRQPWGGRLGVAIAAALVLLAIAAAGRSAAPALAYTSCTVDSSVDSEEREMLRLVNDYRAQHGLGALTLSESLTRSAAWKSKHMGDRGYFAHDDTPIGRTWVDRFRDCGYTFNTWMGENIAAGNASAAATFEQWRNSPGHNANMLGDTYVAIGLGRAYNADSDYGWYWTQEFGGAVEATMTGGDVDCDDRVDAVDASLILQRSAGIISTLPCGGVADVDGSGSVDAADALIVLQYFAGLIAGAPG